MATQRTRWFMVVTIWLLHGLLNTHSFELTSVLPNVIYGCVNDNVTFNWTYTTSPGDVVFDTEWYATGHSEELVAIKTGTHFVPLPSFSHRVEFVPNAGFVLNDVTIGDSGNYSVRISGTDASGASFTASSYVLLDVSRKNELRTSDGHLHAKLEEQPVYNNLTGQWSFLLTCGHFTYPTRPPFDVTWQTPSDDVIPSVTYDNGVFQLLVQTGGNYTCRIPTEAVADACLTSEPEAAISLDKMDVRLRLLEARQTQLQTENQQLKNQLADTRTQLQNTQTLLEQKDASLTESLQNLTNKMSHQIGFNGILSSNGVHSGRLPFIYLVTNYGNAFTPTTGTFRATISGLYFFTVTATPTHSNVYPDTGMFKNSQSICQADAAGGNAGQSISCSTVQHLSVGDEVYVHSGNDLAAGGTSFSGFLIVAD